MTFEEARELLRKADRYREAREHESAATYYTRTAYAKLGSGEMEWFDQMSGGLVSLLKAGLCYRLAGEGERAENRAKQGILISEDIRDHVVTEDVERALAFEFIGDFRIMGDLGGYEHPYQRAREIYREYDRTHEVGQRLGQMDEEPFDANTMFFRRAAATTSIDAEGGAEGGIEAITLTERLDYKSDVLPEIIEEILEQGEWEWVDLV